MKVEDYIEFENDFHNNPKHLNNFSELWMKRKFLLHYLLVQGP